MVNFLDILITMYSLIIWVKELTPDMTSRVE